MKFLGKEKSNKKLFLIISELFLTNNFLLSSVLWYSFKDVVFIILKWGFVLFESFDDEDVESFKLSLFLIFFNFLFLFVL